MSSNDPLFRKGSLIPAVLDIEADLIERERDARAEADRLVRDARTRAGQLISTTEKKLPGIEKEERTILADSLTGDAESLKANHNAKMTTLETCIEKNKRRTLEYILSRIMQDIGTGTRSSS